MRLYSNLLALPPSILLLIAIYSGGAHAAEEAQSPAQWPYNLPPHVKYWPEDPPNRRRDLEAIEKHLRLGRSPVGVMKMGEDEGEKFFMEYWQFEGDFEAQDILERSNLRASEKEERLSANASILIPYRPPFSLHVKADPLEYKELRAREVVSGREAAAALAMLQKRAFQCPTGTSACSSIGYPNSCCATDETCFQIQDTGLGPCCPNGSTCGGTITSCDSPNTPCAQDLGGGCCIENYVCAGVGCVINSSLIVTTGTTQTLSATSSSASTSTVVGTTTTSSTTYTGPQTAQACSTNFQACPASIGGGCCPTDRVCAVGSCGTTPGTPQTSTSSSPMSTTATTTTASGVAPVRPTSDTSTTAAITTCPTGFYACDAYYAGGCCRTGRNCDTTSCPASSSTTIISSGVTVVVPVGPAATTASPTGSCATGWFTCAPTDGGNCCPSGYQCGTTSCSSLASTATVVVQKESPNVGGRVAGGIWWLAGVSIMIMVII